MAEPSFENIAHMSERELEIFIDSADPQSRGHELAVRLLNVKKLQSLKHPHWTLTPGFWVAVAAALVAGLAAYFAYLAIPPERRPFHASQLFPNKSISEQKLQSQSKESLPTKAKTSAFSNLPCEHPNQ